MVFGGDVVSIETDRLPGEEGVDGVVCLSMPTEAELRLDDDDDHVHCSPSLPPTNPQNDRFYVRPGTIKMSTKTGCFEHSRHSASR